MSCHGCSQSFGFLNREKGCPKCGFSYCKRCLRYSIPQNVEGSKGGKTLQVCKKCYDIVTAYDQKASQEAVNETLDVRDKLDPLSFKETVQVVKAIHRLESLENPSKPPIILYSKPKHEQAIEKLKDGLTQQDQELVDRLANLRNSSKSKRKSGDAVEEIATRLAHLRGEEHPVFGTESKAFVGTPKKETEEELMDRLAREAALNKRYDDAIVADLEDRLARLRSSSKKSKLNPDDEEIQPVSSGSRLPEPEDLTEEEEMQRIIDQFTAEVELDKSSGTNFKSSVALDIDDALGDVQPEVESEDSDNDRFCRICDAAATIICRDCEDDEFCAKCFKEFHKEIGENHKPTHI